MTCVRLAIASLLLLCSQFTFADSIKTYWVTQVDMYVYPVSDNGGVGHLEFAFAGPHFYFEGYGTMECSNCAAGPFGTNNPYFSAGQGYIEFLGFPTIDGISYEVVYPDTFTFYSSLWDSSGNVVPWVTGSVVTASGVIKFRLQLPTNGSWSGDYTYSDYFQTYFFNRAEYHANQSVVPEPGTLSLTFTGLAGIAGMAKRKYFR